MTKAFSFDHLTATQFEEFCYDLLIELGFINLNWRRGTGKATSPADNGRDIEAERKITDVDGHVSIEKWFVECKHFKEGIDPGKIGGLLSWATAHRPRKALIISSNYLSNPCKNFLDGYTSNNKPIFEIRYWELPDIERLAIGFPRLLNEYGLSGEFKKLEQLHPMHIRYLFDPLPNSLDYFFSLVDKFDQTKRDLIFDVAYFSVVNPRHADYPNFKKRCYELWNQLNEAFIVRGLVMFSLTWAFFYGDKTSQNRVIENNKQIISFLSDKKVGEIPQRRLDELAEICRYLDRDKTIKLSQNIISDMPNRIERSYSAYVAFCEEILPKLMAEPLLK